MIDFIIGLLALVLIGLITMLITLLAQHKKEIWDEIYEYKGWKEGEENGEIHNNNN